MKLSQEKQRKQREDVSIAIYVNRLMIIAKDCGFEDVTAVEYKKESVLQSFIAGLEDPYIRQRILEKDVDLEGALEAAEILKRAKTDANCYETENIKLLLPWSIQLNQNVIWIQNQLKIMELLLIILQQCLKHSKQITLSW